MFKNSSKMEIFISTLILTLIFSSCGKNRIPTGHYPVFIKSKIIVGPLDWREITDFPSNHPYRINASPVGDLRLQHGRCTGFLISNKYLMTNFHCISQPSDASGLVVRFNHDNETPQERQILFDCSKFIGNNSELDYAIVECTDHPGRFFGHVELDDSEVNQNDPIYLVHQNCDYYLLGPCDWTKKVSEGRITDISDKISHDADTLGGSSGSPIFSIDDRVIAIHNLGVGGDSQGRGLRNSSVPMRRIIPDIKTRFAFVLK